MPIRLPVVLSPSRAELGARCHRRHMLDDVLDRQPRDGHWKPSADFGTVIHKGAARYWLGLFACEQQDRAAEAATAAAIETWNQLRPIGDKHTLGMAEAIMAYYVKNITLPGPLAGEWHVYVHDGQPMIEQRLVVQIGREQLSFQIDRLLENSRGQLALIDIKTTARLGDWWRRQFDLWLQGKLYEYGVMQVLGKKIEHLYVEGLQKTIPVKHEHHPCPYWTDDQIEEAVGRFKLVAASDRALLEAALQVTVPEPGAIELDEFDDALRLQLEELVLTDPDFNYQDCFAYNQPCPYLPLCQRPVHQRLGLLQSDYVVAPVEGY